MRKISNDAYRAFVNKRGFRKSNTSVMIGNDGEAHMFLFGNEIAKTKNGKTYISDGNYPATMTTGSRLDRFTGSGELKSIRKSGSSFIINEKFKWSGEWLNINNLPD